MRILATLIITVCMSCSLFANSAVDSHAKVMSAFDIDVNSSNMLLVQNFKKNISSKDKAEFKKALRSSPRNASMIYGELQDVSAPAFLLYLAVAESKLKNRAVSGAKAVGVWQFMKPTAKTFGLKINSEVDERIDPVAATDAAVKYMGYLKNQFGKWYLAIMAYNCGEGCLKKAIDQTGSSDLNELMSSNFLPKETKNFLTQIIQMTYIADSTNLNGYFKTYEQPNRIVKVNVRAGTKLADVGKVIGISDRKMRELNPHLLKFAAPSYSSYHFYMPSNKAAVYANSLIDRSSSKAHLDAIGAQAGKELGIYVVVKGDTLEVLAKRWGVSQKEIKAKNNLKSDKIAINQKIVIPVDKNSENLKSVLSRTYEIQKGDTLASISTKFNVDLKDLRAANDIDDSKIVVGAHIVIP